MANTTAVYARIDTDLKNNAEEILSQLGITPSSAIQMLYSQIVLENGMPFTPKIPYRKPVCVADLTPEQLQAELEKGLEDMRNGRVYTAEEVDEEIDRMTLSDIASSDDPFYSEENQKYLAEIIKDMENGHYVEHDLIEVDDTEIFTDEELLELSKKLIIRNKTAYEKLAESIDDIKNGRINTTYKTE